MYGIRVTKIYDQSPPALRPLCVSYRHRWGGTLNSVRVFGPGRCRANPPLGVTPPRSTSPSFVSRWCSWGERRKGVEAADSLWLQWGHIESAASVPSAAADARR